MASLSPNVSQHFAVGTSLGAYPQSNWGHHQLPPSGAPKGSATASASVAANGTVALTGLADNARYFLTDATGTRYITVHTGLTRSEQQAADYESTVIGSAVRPVSGYTYTHQGVGSTGTRPAGFITFHPFILGKTATFDRIAATVATVGAAGSLVRLGIYNDSEGKPGTVLLDAGTIIGDVGTGTKTVTISQQLTKGRYWLAAAVQGNVTSPTMEMFTGNFTVPYVPSDIGNNLLRQGHGFQMTGQAASGALPTTASNLAVAGTAIIVGLRAA